MKESAAYYSIRAFGMIIRLLPIRVGLWIGNGIGLCAYYFDIRHKSQAYANLKMVFAGFKSPNEIKQLTKKLFKNYGQNIIELFRMPLLTPEKFEQVVAIEGREHLTDALKKGKGAILLAMHFGSWELASLSCAMIGHPYKVFVKPQKKYSRLDNLLNSYRACGGSVVITRGSGTRDFVRSLRKNEVIGMVVDQGGRDGVLVPFFGRNAKMSVGAIRMGLKLGVPICFSIIIRIKGHRHRMIIHQPLELKSTGNLERDVLSNLKMISKTMEEYIRTYPWEYMWFYKIWKYSDEAKIVLLNDGKTGHLRQSQAVMNMTERALGERNIKAKTQVIAVHFKSATARGLFSLLSALLPAFVYQGRLECLKWFLTKSSFEQVAAMKVDFIISCGSTTAGVNNLLAKDSNAKSIVVLRPGLLSHRRFDLVILPQHDASKLKGIKKNVAVTHAAPNLITARYMDDQKQKLLKRYSHLAGRLKPKVGLFIGGDSKTVHLTERQIKILIRQIKEAIQEINMDILITTSRRTPQRIEHLLHMEFKKYNRCPLLILAQQEEIPEAVGGILGLSDIIIVSGDSLSMVSEAASSGKNTIVFLPQNRAKVLKGHNKHLDFVRRLNADGFVLSTNVNHLGQTLYDVAKNKIQSRPVNDNETVLAAVQKVI